MRKKVKNITVVATSLALVMTPFVNYGTDIKVHAIETDTSDATVKGSGSFNAAKGNWCTDTTNPTIYRVYPIKLEKSLNKVDKNSKVVTNYKKQYYDYRDLALYVTSDSKATQAYHFTSPTERGTSTIAGMTLNSDGSYDFSALGVSLNLPTHTFNINKSKYISFSNELNKKIITEGEDENIKEIFYNYITEVKSRKSKLSSKGKNKLNELISLSGYDTDNFDDFCRSFAFVVEVCSTAINMQDGKHYVLSYGDMTKGCKIGDDAYYIYKVFDDAYKDNSLLTWHAQHHERDIDISPEDALGEATFFFCNLSSKKSVAQSLNITLSLDEELKSDINTDDVSKSYGVSTSEINPNVDLGAEEYKQVMENAYDNTLSDTKISLMDSNKVLKTADKSSSLKILSGRDDYNDKSILLGYQTLSIPIDSSSYDLDDLSEVDMENALNNVSVHTKTTSVYNGFGNKYSLNFNASSNSTVRKSVANAIKDVDGVSSVSSGVSYDRNGVVENMADLQSATFLSSKVSGKPIKDNKKIFKGADGEIYASISYLAKDKKVTSKEAEVFIDKNSNIEVVKGIDTKKYSVTNSNKWGINKKDKSYTYAIAWRASDYNLTDEKSLTEDIISSLDETFVLRGNAGVSTLSQGFENVTGVEPLGVKYMQSNNSLEVGSVPNEDKTLSGINVLVINASYELPVSVASQDIVKSDELNYVYPNLLGNKSGVNSIIPIAAYVDNISYPYTVTDENMGDLIDFKGSNAHYYYKPTGLFGVYKENPKSFYSVCYPSYAYNLTRTLWKDNLVASNYRGVIIDNEDIKNDIKNNLGFSIGAFGKLSKVTCGENVDSIVDTKKKDEYKFKGTITKKYPLYTETVYEFNKYKLTHSLGKYTCLSLDTALNSNANKAGFSIQSDKGIDNKITMVTQSKNPLIVYPEVAYTYYYADKTNGVLNNVKPYTIYMMGERERSMKASSIRGIDMRYKTGYSTVADGSIQTDGAKVGSEAYEASEGKQVLAQGTDICLAAKHNVDYRLISYSLDVVKEYNGVSVRNAFSGDNFNYKPDEEHEDYVQDFIKNVIVDTYMHIGDKEYKMKTSNTTPKVSKNTVCKSFAIEFANGEIDEVSKNMIINDMMKEYNITHNQAYQMFESSGFEKQLQDMFESNNDEDNKSRDKWYDEQSVTLCVRKYVTSVDLKELIVNDKIDYNTVGTEGIKENGETINTTEDGYFTLGITLADDFNGCNLESKNKLICDEKIAGSDFKVSSSTTYDFGW